MRKIKFSVTVRNSILCRQCVYCYLSGGFAHDDTSVYGDRRGRPGGGGGDGGYNNYDNWEVNPMRGGAGGGGGRMYNDDYRGGPPNQGFYPPPPPPPPQMMGGGGGGGPGPMRPLIDSYDQPPGSQTQQVRFPTVFSNNFSSDFR